MFTNYALRKTYPYSKFFWSAFPLNTDQENFEYGHFLRSDVYILFVSKCGVCTMCNELVTTQCEAQYNKYVWGENIVHTGRW